MKAVEVHGFAGAFAIGVTRAGFELAGRMTGPADFGGQLVAANAHLLPGDWETASSDWPQRRAQLVYGNPPCSGFSVLGTMTNRSIDAGNASLGGHRGVDSHLNAGMYQLIDYAAAIVPEVIVFESVTNALFQGRDLMQQLRLRLEASSGHRYDLIHVLQDNASVGGASIRKRYFFVASRVPFGIDHTPPARVRTLRETIGDLEHAPLAWDGTPDGHQRLLNSVTRHAERLAAVADEAGVPWPANIDSGNVVEALEAAGYDMSWVPRALRLKDHHPFGTTRWAYDEPARTVTGRHLARNVHPAQGRFMTFRETARIMGFPDEWSIQAARTTSVAWKWFGQGIPVEAGEWIASWAKRAIERRPGSYQGRVVGEREYVIDVIGTWKRPAAVHEAQLALPLTA